jgi:hypothetical protein
VYDIGSNTSYLPVTLTRIDTNKTA